MANVLMFHGITTLDIPADRVLENNKGDFEKVILIGIDHDGKFICATNIGEISEVNLLMDRFKKYLINLIDEED